MNDSTYIPARPKSAAEIRTLPHLPEIAVAAECREITQVVHFTTMSGTVGILASKALKSRARVHEDQYLEHVYSPNVWLRKDPDWLDYVNLSIERINDWMFQTSERWHPKENNSWVVLSICPQILTHPGVVFTTTNNIYSTCLRAEGLAGFQRMFADSIRNYDGTLYDRSGKMNSWPTDRQAEVLYPGEIPSSNIRQIEVQTEYSLETIDGLLGALGISIPVRLAPEVFE